VPSNDGHTSIVSQTNLTLEKPIQAQSMRDFILPPLLIDRKLAEHSLRIRNNMKVRIINLKVIPPAIYLLERQFVRMPTWLCIEHGCAV
jgi:hypothetical protein